MVTTYVGIGRCSGVVDNVRQSVLHGCAAVVVERCETVRCNSRAWWQRTNGLCDVDGQQLADKNWCPEARVWNMRRFWRLLYDELVETQLTVEHDTYMDLNCDLVGSVMSHRRRRLRERRMLISSAAHDHCRFASVKLQLIPLGLRFLFQSSWAVYFLTK